MYIFELIANAFKSKKYRRFEYADSKNTETVSDETGNCMHVFLPLDSSNEMFACKYCGLVVPKSRLKDRNIFRKFPG